MKKEIVYCDVCEQQGNEENNIFTAVMDVIFTTEQTEGRSCNPHLSREKIDICKNCTAKVLEGNYIFASGAQGFNRYYFKNS